MSDSKFQIERVQGAPVSNEEILTDIRHAATLAGTNVVSQRLYSEFGKFDPTTAAVVKNASNATIDSQGSEHNDLTIDAGTASVFFNANIGNATATSSLGNLTVVDAAGGVTFGQTDANTGAGGTGPVTVVNTNGAMTFVA